MKPRKPRRIVPLPGGCTYQHIDAGQPTYYTPVAGTPAPVKAVVVNERQVLEAGPRLTPEEWQAWRKTKQPRGRAVVDPEPDGPPADEGGEPISHRAESFTAAEIERLPRWAEFAFMARCVRRIIPLFFRSSQAMQTNKDLASSMLWAVEVTERIASDPDADIYDRRRSRNVADYAGRDEVDARSEPYVYNTAFALGALADGDVGKSFYYFKDVVDNFGVGIDVFIDHDMVLLQRLSSLNNWTDETPVPPTVFGPLWPDGPPAGWPADENPDREIVLEIDLPDDATDDDAKRFAQLLVSKADDIYRAGGGNGLKISGLDITCNPLATKPTPTTDHPENCEIVGGGAS